MDWHYSNALVDILCQHLDQSKKSLLIACHDLNWCLQFDQNLGQRSQAYCLDQGRMIAKNDIKNLLLDPNTQKAFNFVSKITDNPIDNSNLLVVAAYDKQRQQQTQS